MTACVLCELYGYQGYLWQGWDYMKAYAGKGPRQTLKAIMELLSEVETVVVKILAVREQLNSQVGTVA